MKKPTKKFPHCLFLITCVFLLAGPLVVPARGKLPPPPVQQDKPDPQQGSTAPPPPVTVSARLASAEVEKGSTVSMVINISWSAPADKPVPELDFDFAEPPTAQGMTLFENKLRTVTDLSGNTLQVKRTYYYTFHADNVIETEVSPVKINYYRQGSENKKTLSTQSLPITVVEPSWDPLETARHPTVLITLGLIALAAATALILPAFRKRGRKEKQPEPELTVHQKARQSLERVARLRMAGEYADYLASLHNTVSDYLEDALDLKLKPLSVEKKAKAVAQKLGGDWEESALEFLRLCDRVRFAGYEPSSSELDRADRIAAAMVDEGEKLDSAKDHASGEKQAEDHTHTRS
ncbi:MAG: hypothetical protein R6V10_05300 [bacterium]